LVLNDLHSALYLYNTFLKIFKITMACCIVRVNTNLAIPAQRYYYFSVKQIILLKIWYFLTNCFLFAVGNKCPGLIASKECH
jgi:hypothetical protein